MFISLIRAMCGLFRAIESKVAQSLVCEYYRDKVRQVGYTKKQSRRWGMLLQNYCAPEACCLYGADLGYVWAIPDH